MASKLCAPGGEQCADRVELMFPSREFDLFRRGLEDCFSISLPAVELDLSSSKEFCSGLLTGRNHLWFRAISRLPLRDRLSIAGSLFLFRKICPSSSPSPEAYLAKMSQPAVEPPPGFMGFVHRSVKSMFPLGWDRGWQGRVRSTTLSTSSCLESSRKDGGARALLLWCREQPFSREEFCRDLLDRYSVRHPSVSFARVAQAPCAGKVRLVSVNSVDMAWLKPYHTLLYDFISDMDWCLRGDAKASRFSDFVSVDGEVFVSGDYESATDNLNQDVARNILTTIGSRCTRVPLFVREASLRTLGGELSCGGVTVTQRRGQLMGNAMSFPLLCLQNYLAFRFLVRREVPVRINGDDIVFRARPDEVAVWVAGVSACGLKLSLGKTNFEKRWFSLNSSFFVAGRKRVRCAPVVRSTAMFRPLERVDALKGRLETLRGFRSDRRVVWEKLLLSRVVTSVWASQRSLLRGLDCRFSHRSIIESGLRDRELFYLALPPSVDTGPPGVDLQYANCPIPDGWYRQRLPRRRPTDPEFISDLVDSCWYPVESTLGYREWVARSFRYVRPARVSVLRLCRGPLWVMARVVKGVLPPFRSLGFPCWRREDAGGALWQRPVVFRVGA